MQCGIRSPRLPLSGDRCTGKTLPVLLLPPHWGRRYSFFAGEFWRGKRCDSKCEWWKRRQKTRHRSEYRESKQLDNSNQYPAFKHPVF